MKIDLNSDLGESYGSWRMGNDQEILKLVSSANIACGFHAGDPKGILSTLRQAYASKVAIGAHVAYPDLVGFGRRNMDVSYDELYADVLYQLAALDGLARSIGATVSYVKPHGALYNTIAHNLTQAKAVADAIKAFNPTLKLVALAGSDLVGFAREQGLQVVSEAFADRAYNSDGSLVSRRLEGAVLHDASQIAQRVVGMVKDGGVMSIDGTFTSIQADSICVHGDTQGALEITQKIIDVLSESHIGVTAFSAKAEG
ncbi:LamB/YcsF family protein [Acinetobacter rathckeae]|uniref:LamB/YcsF family protein n=1 Tax=Acinetobacter rathckeae TaxID=2605272 RepID=UPI0018A2D01B|nr:5-oxoprolinase subunit PxpA [Acinetobacter rathckeae]MBF7688977.1 LamB/YcsF family protein [Acinetobacter rathckeae]MBF7696376.1 LamB/YcsF family protein [Acinetobacter rathckeae]